jgi:hypothetical protein
MKGLEDVFQPVLARPTPEALVALQGTLLSLGQEGAAVEHALEVAGQFYEYLTELQGKISARQYSEFASMLDIGAVGVVALENLLFTGKEDFLMRLAVGGLAEGLMVGASRQYVKGWAVESGVVHAHAVWYLTGALWRISSEMQPDLDAELRWRGIQSLLAPASDPDVPSAEKALLLGRVYQILLLTYLAALLPGA